MESRKSLLATALVAVVCSGFIVYLLERRADQERKIQALEATISQLQSALAIRDAGPDGPPPSAAERKNEPGNAAVDADRTEPGAKASEVAVSGNATGSLQILKDLENVSEADSRSYLEKLQELLSGTPTDEEVAIASRFVFNKAGDREGLPDYALQSLYANQHDADLRRVIAQVLSQRGNNTLLNNQIAETQARLTSPQPRDRQDALAQLAKLHSSKAVDAIAPLLQDPDTTVRLEALFALRDTGNQQHVHLVEPLLNDPDPSVRSLAGEVSGSLKNLSASARTRYSRSEIEAELPPIANP